MNVISVISLLLIIPYILIALTRYKKQKGYYRFRRTYPALLLGLVGGLFFSIFESEAIGGLSGHYPGYAQQLRIVCALVLILIPVNIVLITINAVIKKPKPVIMFIVSCAISTLGVTGILIYSYFADNAYYSIFEEGALTLSIVMLPLIISFAAGGLVPYEGKFGKVVHWVVQVLVLAALVWLVSSAAYGSDYLKSLDFEGIMRYIPLILGCLIIPGLPMLLLLLEDNKTKR